MIQDKYFLYPLHDSGEVLYYGVSSVCLSIWTLFPDNSSYSF